MRAPIWMLTIALAAGCTNAMNPELPDELETRQQPLGEANLAVWFSGEGAQEMPSYDERVAWAMLNQVRTNTDVYELVDGDDNPILPMPPLTLQPGMVEAGRWQGAHVLETNCGCAHDFESGQAVEALSGQNPYTCCTVGYVNGTMRCVGPVVSCGDDGMTTAQDRWALLNKGAGGIGSELFILMQNPEQATGQGAGETVLNGALGLFLSPRDGGGAAARVEMPDVTADIHWTFITGPSTEPVPVLSDVIHVQLEAGPIFTAHYFEPTGDPATLSIVTDSACLPLERMFERPSEAPDADPIEDFPYVGNSYFVAAPTTSGCVRYVAHAVSAEGFDYVYPTFGSLGMQVQGGEIVPNDESCPIWVPDSRPAPSCMPAATECTNGATRLCYTGRAGTEDKGVCNVGSETCQNGRWSGLCAGEVRPAPTDTCDDGLDNNCNGFVDEDCPAPVLPVPEPEPEPETPDEEDEEPAPAPPTEDDGGCCATVAPSSDDGPALVLAGLLGAVALRRRR